MGLLGLPRISTTMGACSEKLPLRQIIEVSATI